MQCHQKQLCDHCVVLDNKIVYVCTYFGAGGLGQQYLVICAIQIIFADDGSISDEIFETWKMILSRKVGGLSSRWQTDTCTWQF